MYMECMRSMCHSLVIMFKSHMSGMEGHHLLPRPLSSTLGKSQTPGREGRRRDLVYLGRLSQWRHSCFQPVSVRTWSHPQYGPITRHYVIIIPYYRTPRSRRGFWNFGSSKFILPYLSSGRNVSLMIAFGESISLGFVIKKKIVVGCILMRSHCFMAGSGGISRLTNIRPHSTSVRYRRNLWAMFGLPAFIIVRKTSDAKQI